MAQNLRIRIEIS